MDTDQTGSGAAAASVGDSAVTDQDSDNQTKETTKTEGDLGEQKMVDWKNHRRALDDMHRYKNEAAELRAAKEELEVQALQEKEDYKTLAERERAKRLEAEQEREKLKTSFVDTQKFAAIREACVKAGMRPEALKHLDRYDWDGVTVEYTSNGRLLIHGQELAVNDLKKTDSYLFSSAEVPTINSGGAANRGTSTKPPEITAEGLLKMEAAWKRGEPGAREAYVKARTQFISNRQKEKLMIATKEQEQTTE